MGERAYRRKLYQIDRRVACSIPTTPANPCESVVAGWPMSVGNVTIRQLQDSIEAHRRLLSAANQKAEQAQRQLIRIGLDYCGQRFDQMQKNGLILDTASPQIL